MALITQTQVIDAPIDRVFDTVIDVGNYAAWNPPITAARRLDEGELRDGSRFERQLQGFGVAIQEFQEFERNARVRFRPGGTLEPTVFAISPAQRYSHGG
jgi:uncharacterized protein YndB with AHSA1/START domain